MIFIQMYQACACIKNQFMNGRNNWTKVAKVFSLFYFSNFSFFLRQKYAAKKKPILLGI